MLKTDCFALAWLHFTFTLCSEGLAPAGHTVIQCRYSAAAAVDSWSLQKEKVKSKA